MTLEPENIDELNRTKALQFFKPLLYNIVEEENKAIKYLRNNSKKKEIDYNKSFMVFSDIQMYKSLSIEGIYNNFDRSITYQVLPVSMILDVWYSKYNATDMYTKDSIRKCDILILHGRNDYSFGDKKASVLIDILSERRSYGKITWIFIEGCNSKTYNHYQPGVINELKQDNIYDIRITKNAKLDEILKEDDSDESSKSKPKQVQSTEESKNAQRNNREDVSPI